MKRRAFVMAAAALAAPAFGQGSKPLPRVSFVSHASQKAWGHFLDEFKAGMRALGLVEGRDYVVDARWADDRVDRVPDLMAKALAAKPAVIVTHGTPGVSAAQKATSTVPVVFASVGDPVDQGFVKSYRRPGGNITGVAFNTDIAGKVLELVKIVLPAASRVGLLLNPDLPGANKAWTDVLSVASKTLGFQPAVLEARTLEALEAAFTKAIGARMQALVVATSAPFVGSYARLAELQFKHRLPTFQGLREGAHAGGLASYAFPQEENYRRAAAIVDKILKGGKPAEIPVEIPTTYEITINLKTAKALGIKVPEAALLRAHKVIQA